jgi:BirA family transcriptional regulator, biotin operon repressor / biotin---[acetyl-CoA-carboxylase] ligase
VTEADPRDEMLLELLAEAGAGSVPGEILSGKLGLEPSEVYHRVDGLRARGYRIDRVPRGYRLVAVPDRVGPLEIVPFLTTQELGRGLHYRQSVPSTNDVAFRLAREGAFHGEVVVAEAQTQGRGRRGRTWVSPAKRNLYFSVVLRPPLPAVRAPELTFVAAVALAETLRDAFDLEAGIKWPNDVQVAGRKIAGILPELETEADAGTRPGAGQGASGDQIAFVILGIGLNVNMRREELPEEIAKIATSVCMELDEQISRPLLLAAVLARLEWWYQRWLDEGFAPILDTFRKLDVTVGRAVRIVDGVGGKAGRAEDVDDDGALVVRLEDGRVERVISGDVVFAD